MPLPDGLVLVTLTDGGAFTRPDGFGANGTITFEMPSALALSASHSTIGNAPPIRVPVVDGVFSVQLPATDQAGMTPVGWAYQVTVATDAWRSTFYAQVPSTPSPTTLDRLVPLVVPPTAGLYVEVGLLGQPGGVAQLTGPGGTVPPEQLPAGSGGAVVTAVNTRTGDVTLAKADVGLSSVDNTADVNKPISTPAARAFTQARPTLPLSFWNSAAAATVSPDDANQGSADSFSHGAVLWLPYKAAPYTTAFTYVRTAGTRGAGAGDLCGFAVWDMSNNLLGSSANDPDMWISANLGAAGLVSKVVGSFSVPDGGMFVRAEISTKGYDTPPAMHFDVVASSSNLSAAGGANGPRSWFANRSAWPNPWSGAADGGGYVPLILMK